MHIRNCCSQRTPLSSQSAVGAETTHQGLFLQTASCRTQQLIANVTLSRAAKIHSSNDSQGGKAAQPG